DVELTVHALRKQKLDNHIHVVRDGAEALDYLFCTGVHAQRRAYEGPQGVLLDLKLPLVDGLEVLRRLPAGERTGTLPVVMLTSFREERDLVESYKVGVNSYVVKPVDFQQFTEAVCQIGLYWVLLNASQTS